MAKISNTNIASRKARRKEDRHAKKRKPNDESAPPPPLVQKKQKVMVRPSKTTPGKIQAPQARDEGSAKSKNKYAGLDAETAAAMKRDDDEIAELEEKMGLKAGSKEKARLHREYAKLEGFGDDFGDFLDGLDHLMTHGISDRDNSESAEDPSDDAADNYDDSSEDEELVPMKGPMDAQDFDNDDESVVAELSDEGSMEHEQSSDDDDIPTLQQMDRSSVDDDASEVGEPIKGDASNAEPDHDVTHIYRPTVGEDIYGNKIDNNKAATQTKKYVPPHLRNNQQDNQDRKEKLRGLQRSLNNALNRLSEDTLISVAQSVTGLYPLHATSDVNECLWTNVFNASVDRPTLMTGMIPVYVACLVGVHVQTGDTVQLGGFLIEHVVTKLWSELQSSRLSSSHDAAVTPSDVEVNKEVCNLMLVLCYLYNYSMVHSTFMYDVIRHFINHFSELDVELLLLTLSHCGHSLRSDDPSSLKEIVLMVQKRTQEDTNQGRPTSSRLGYMISAMTDLKNNNKRKQDTVFSEKTAKLRKQIGRIKSSAASAGISRAADSCLRISLEDILSVESKGRWWKVGASWVGNQYTHHDGDDADDNKDESGDRSEEMSRDQKDTADEEELLKLASKYRMNTDSRRSAFCIVMGSADCDDAFEKLVRMSMLTNRTERETVRVLMECCGNETTYNPFYSHLAARICDYQPQCKFTFQLAFWDVFKQFEEVKLRKAANLAKLLYHLVVVHNSLRLTVLKVIDMAPNTMEEPAMIFLTVFFSTMFESFDDPFEIQQIFDRSLPRRRIGDSKGATSEVAEHHRDSEGMKESLSVFFLKTLKSSPKNKKKSKFRANLKAAVKFCQTDELDSMVDVDF